MSHTSMPQDWLMAECQRAAAEVASWSPERQAAMRAAAAPSQYSNPCRYVRACDEAQTCVGGCVHDSSIQDMR